MHGGHQVAQKSTMVTVSRNRLAEMVTPARSSRENSGNSVSPERLAEEGFVSAHSQVFSLTDLDRTDEMLHWLEVSLETRDRVALLMLVHPAFDDLRADPRFQSLVEQVGFPGDPAGLIGRGFDS